MAMDDVESIGAGEYGLGQKRVQRDGGRGLALQAQRPLAYGDELRGGVRVAAGEEGDVVSLPHQLIGEIGDDALGAPIKLRRNALVQWCDLGDAQGLPRSIDCPLNSKAHSHRAARSMK